MRMGNFRKENEDLPAVRDAFFNRLYERICEGEDIVVVSADLGAPSLDALRRDFPERFINVGIAEQDLIAVAAGLALSGRSTVAFALNPFPVTRAYDQLRTLLAELRIPVTLCALNAGLCSAESGYTHMPIEDVGMVRMLRNVRIFNPSDATMARMLADEVGVCKMPRYIRFDKNVGGTFYRRDEIDFHSGFWQSGGGISHALGIVSYGCYMNLLREIARELEAQGRDVLLIDLHTLPADEQKLSAVLGSCQRILTVEENMLPGGVGAYVLEVLSDHGLRAPVKRMGLQLREGYYNVFTDRDYIRRDQKIDEASIRSEINAILREGAAHEAQR